MSIQHTVVFRLVHESGSTAELDFLETGRATLTSIPGVTDFTINRQISPKSDLTGQFSMAFANQATYGLGVELRGHLSGGRFVGVVWSLMMSRWRSSLPC